MSVCVCVFLLHFHLMKFKVETNKQTSKQTKQKTKSGTISYHIYITEFERRDTLQPRASVPKLGATKYKPTNTIRNERIE